jgi:hypothetical protein
MSADALIGHSGFVGGVLARQHMFKSCFNRSNIDSVVGLEFDTLVCAAAPGSMFTANREPERDRVQIEALIKHLDGVRVRRFVLISSIAVLADFASGDDESTQAFRWEVGYGHNRRMLEEFVENKFKNSLVVRLPALFGHGLQKNFIFDLLNPIPTMLTEAKLEALSGFMDRQLFNRLLAYFALNPGTGMLKLDRMALNIDPARIVMEEELIIYGFSATQFHNPETTYQYYNMTRLWLDINVALHAGLSHIHLVSEPLEVAHIHRRLTGYDMRKNGARLHNEDMRTRHSDLWGKDGFYLENADAVLEQLAAFYASERRIR